MQQFAFVFRSGSSLSAEALATRNAAARAWALERRDEGVLAAAAPLAPEAHVVSAAETVVTTSDVASVLVIEAADLEHALAIARAHPGLAFGTRIEVRAVRVTP